MRWLVRLRLRVEVGRDQSVSNYYFGVLLS